MIGKLLRAALIGACLFVAAGAHARGSDALSLDQLPREARHTLDLIQSNGPFPYDRDGVVFGNRERLLPPHPRGYYREYTVKMPGTRGRGAHRIVCGGNQRETRDCYYTSDHYQTFRRISMKHPVQR